MLGAILIAIRLISERIAINSYFFSVDSTNMYIYIYIYMQG